MKEVKVRLSVEEIGLLFEWLGVLIDSVNDLSENEYDLLYNKENQETAIKLLEKLDAANGTSL